MAQHLTRKRNRSTSFQIFLAGVEAGGAAGTLKPWREVVAPHADVASGRYQQAEFVSDCLQELQGTYPHLTGSKASSEKPWHEGHEEGIDRLRSVFGR